MYKKNNILNDFVYRLLTQKSYVVLSAYLNIGNSIN